MCELMNEANYLVSDLDAFFLVEQSWVWIQKPQMYTQFWTLVNI